MKKGWEGHVMYGNFPIQDNCSLTQRLRRQMRVLSTALQIMKKTHGTKKNTQYRTGIRDTNNSDRNSQHRA